MAMLTASLLRLKKKYDKSGYVEGLLTYWQRMPNIPDGSNIIYPSWAQEILRID